MRTWWLKVSCFITGFDYDLISVSSRISKTIVLKNMSAMSIICLIWALVGYLFGKRYLKMELPGAVLVAVCLVFFVIQIERQIIIGKIGQNDHLSPNENDHPPAGLN